VDLAYGGLRFQDRKNFEKMLNQFKFIRFLLNRGYRLKPLSFAVFEASFETNCFEAVLS
jgi:hypothetical protein